MGPSFEGLRTKLPRYHYYACHPTMCSPSFHDVDQSKHFWKKKSPYLYEGNLYTKSIYLLRMSTYVMIYLLWSCICVVFAPSYILIRTRHFYCCYCHIVRNTMCSASSDHTIHILCVKKVTTESKALPWKALCYQPELNTWQIMPAGTNNAVPLLWTTWCLAIDHGKRLHGVLQPFSHTISE